MEFPFNLFDLNSVFEFATSQSASYWINLGVTFLLSSIITGVLLVVVMSIASKETGEPVKVGNAFLVVLLVNLINFFGIMGIMLSFMTVVPFAALILPAVIWIVLLKLFFGEMSLLHVLVIGIIFYAITLFAVPYITGFIVGFIPL
jgi:hypothetical protein